MDYEVLMAVIDAAIPFATPYTQILHGSMPESNGLAAYISSGAPYQRHMDKGGIYDLSITLNGKHEQVKVLVSALSKIHTELVRMEEYPHGEGWQILDIESATPPTYTTRETSDKKQWLYASVLRVRFYMKGEE